MRLFEAFGRAARAAPTRCAVEQGTRQWSYRQAEGAVAERARCWSGTEAGSAVGLCLPRSAELVWWQLAANARGLVFLPVDPALPPERQATLQARAQPRWWVTEPLARPEGNGWQLRQRFDQAWLWTRADGHRYPEGVTHLYFSSGSTGEPKAILLKDGPMVDVVRQQAQRLGLSPTSRFGWLLSPGFDASLSDCYQPLLAGATLVVYPGSLTQRKTVQAFLADTGITHVDLPPSLLPLLDPTALPTLEGVIFGGELASEAVVQAWRQAVKALYNAYGPTETSVCCSLKQVDPTWRATNIGQPLKGVHYALATADGLSEPTAGASGELVILGEHLAVGYDQAELTARRFRATPLGRGYWTGDLVTVAIDGDLHFLGRVDRQLKRNGVLVCPEELERQALAEGCREARVRLEEERLVLHYSGALDEDTLRQRLQASLPRPFWPQRLVRADSLAKTPSGKVAA